MYHPIEQAFGEKKMLVRQKKVEEIFNALQNSYIGLYSRDGYVASTRKQWYNYQEWQQRHCESVDDRDRQRFE